MPEQTDSSGQTIGGQNTIELMAGRHPNGEMIIERVLVSPQPQEKSFLILKSPVFVRGIARGDVVQQMDDPVGAFRVLQHSGNLCVRIYSKGDNEALVQALSAELEKLGGDLDVQEQRVLVYSIHVSCGFEEVVRILNEQLAGNDQAAWFYGNVYDPDSGEPLNWWQPILSPDAQ